MQTLIIAALALGLALLGVYAFPIPKASFRVIYSHVPETVVAALSAFRRRSPLKHFRAGRITWGYHDEGTGGDVILFLHGMGGAGDIWFLQIEALKDRFRCIAVTYPPLPTLEMLRSGILGILEQEKLSRVNVAGSSMGGYLAQFLAGSDPDRVKMVVLGNTFPPNDLIPRRARMGVRYLPWVPEWAILAGVRKNTARLLYPASGNCELVNAYLYEQTCGTMRKQEFIADLYAERKILDAYTKRAIGAGVGLERLFEEGLKGTIGLTAEHSIQTRDGEKARFTLLGVPMTVSLDRSDNLLNPTEGYRLVAGLTPYVDTLNRSSRFVVGRLTGTAYLDLSSDKSTVIAGRAARILAFSCGHFFVDKKGAIHHIDVSVSGERALPVLSAKSYASYLHRMQS